MTVITGLFSEDTALLLGDILTSIETTDSTYPYLPTVGLYPSQATTKATFKPFSYFQKVNLLSPKLAVAWSGSKDEATSYFNEIISTQSHINPKIENLINITNDINPDLQIIGMLMEKDRYHWFSRNCKLIDNCRIDASETLVGGSGMSKFLEFTEFLDFHFPDGNPTKRDMLLGKALGIIGVLLSEEIRTGSTIRDLFGAGYEIVLIDENNNFKKFSDITYVFWDVGKDKESGNNFIRPILINKYFYEDDQLFIRSFIPNDYPNFEKNTICVPPIFRFSPKTMISSSSIQDLNSNNIVSIYFTEVEGKVYATSRIVINSSNELRPIVFSITNKDEINFSINLEIVNDHIKKFFSDFNIDYG